MTAIRLPSASRTSTPGCPFTQAARERRAELDGPLETEADHLGHPVASEHRGDERLALAAAVAVEHHVRSQPLEQAGHVAAVRRGQEQGGELLTLGPGRLEPRPSLVDAAPGPGKGLLGTRPRSCQ